MPLSFQHLTRLVSLALDSSKNLASVPQLPKSLHGLCLEKCSKLQRLPELPNHLEELDLFGCLSLIEIPSSIQHLTRLKRLDLRHCISLTSIPDCSGLISLRFLHLAHCLILERLPEIPNSLGDFSLQGCISLSEIPSSFKRLNKLYAFILEGSEGLASIPDLIGLKSLLYLWIFSCSKLKVLPEFPNKLALLTLRGCESLTSIPDLMGLKSLGNLTIDRCSKLEMLPEFPNGLRRLTLEGCESLTSLPDLMGLKYLQDLTIDSCSKLKVLPEFPNNLLKLILVKCGITEIPESITNLSKLSFLNISHCERLRVLPKLPWAHVDACNCASLQELSCPSFPNYCFSNFSTPFPSDGPWFMGFPSPRAFRCLVEHTEQGMMTASLPSFPLDGQVCVRRYPTLRISYPGSEIPEQFTFQCSGSFIDVKLPLDWINYNSLCFALCAVVSFTEQFESRYEWLHWSDAFVTYKCYSKSKEGEHNWNGIDGTLGQLHYSANCMQSSHVIIWFGLHFFGKHNNEFTFKFGNGDGFAPVDDEYCKVEKCGVHLIFGKQRILQGGKMWSASTKSDGEESIKDDEPHLEEFNEDDEPYPKRLKHI